MEAAFGVVETIRVVKLHLVDDVQKLFSELAGKERNCIGDIFP